MILFSKPSPALLENGRLFGSAHTLSSRAVLACDQASKRAAASRILRKAEDIELASFRRALRQVPHGSDEPERGRFIAWIEVAGDDRARPSADAGKDRHELMPVGA